MNTKKISTIAFLTCVALLPQSCSASFWKQIKKTMKQDKEQNLIFKTCSLNEKLDDLNYCTREEREACDRNSKAPRCRRLDDDSQERTDLRFCEQQQSLTTDRVIKVLQDYFEHISQNPQEVLKIKPFVLPSSESHGCRGILARRVSKEFKNEFKKCVNKHSLLPCQKAFLFIGNPLFGGSFAKDLLQEMKREMRKEKPINIKEYAVPEYGPVMANEDEL